ncbi:uncharacterized protein LOC125586144 [Brassica napus]|uniref:uncharacterized protein LOC125586144 n=1 Tax=Brassica napus TaxID=3708 RepID=UPI00207B015B|nr:uncharacterized protein LOC125586144 [Brassica napus]
MKPRQKHTWLFKQILQERQTALQWFQIDPGDGTNISFWKDPWTKFGKLINFIGHTGPRLTGPRLTGIHLDTSVADVWRDGGWLIHSARSSEMEELITYLTTITLIDAPSSPFWINNGRNMRSFSSSNVYNFLLPTTPTVPWRPLIWIKRDIPKHQTLAWLMLLNRSPTRDRLITWGLQVDPLCLLCNQGNESRDHLFFSCSFSATVWNHFSTSFGITSPSTSWSDVAQSLMAHSGTKTSNSSSPSLGKPRSILSGGNIMIDSIEELISLLVF